MSFILDFRQCRSLRPYLLLDASALGYTWRMKIALNDLRDKMTDVLGAKGYAGADIPFLIDMYLGGELRGHTSHGLASFVSFAKDEKIALDEPEVLKATNACIYIDAKSNPGALVGKRAADEAIARATKEVTGIAIIKNMDSWLRPGAVAEYIADQGFVAVVINSGGGAAIAPPGGYDAVTGTNPIAYGIPTDEGSLVVDMATSKRAWGQVRLANKYGTDLPADTFYDSEGNVALDPAKANSVMPFGEYKGFSLALLVELLCGSMLGMDTLVQSDAGNKFGQKMPERGAIILVIDPDQTVGIDAFRRANSRYLQKIRATRALPGKEVRIPGDKAGRDKAAKLKANEIELPDELWGEIQGL